MIKENNWLSLFTYEIKREEDTLYEFSFSKIKDTTNYKLEFSCYFDLIEKYFKNDEEGLFVKGLLARVLSKFFLDFKIKPEDKQRGFDFFLSIEFNKKIVENTWIDVFKLYEKTIKDLLLNTVIVLSRDNINSVINWFEANVRDNKEHLIIVDIENNNIIEIKDNVDIQDDKTLGLYLTENDIETMKNINKLMIIHNHKNNLTFSKEDYEVYDKLTKILNKKFLFMVYNYEKQQMKEIITNTVYE